MSYDISLEADLGGPEPAIVFDSWNYTSNCAPMWRLAGANLAEYDGKTAGECLPSLRGAVVDMDANPAKYEAMNPENGWGALDTLLPELRTLVEIFEWAPQAKVRVSR